MNIVNLIGNLCKDNEVKTTNDGKYVVRNSIAVKREYKNSNGEYDSDFINIAAFGTAANFMKDYCRKGNKVALTGRWQTGSYADQYGNKHYTNDMVVASVENLTPRSTNEQPAAETIPAPTTFDTMEITDDELPF